jgi:ABC-type lipoprotein export system ATPase subunit/GNAT superfamily N-acetyltransferase
MGANVATQITADRPDARGNAPAEPRRTVDLHCTRDRVEVRPSSRTADVVLRFGVSQTGTPQTIVEPARIAVGPGRIVLLLGPSGSGKSSALSAIESQFATACSVQRVAFPLDEAVIDRVAPDRPLSEAIALLTACGLGEAGLWLRPFGALSDGEKFRARLARAIALHLRTAAAAPLLGDEFCSSLHPRVARAIAFNLHKLVVRQNLCVVVACANDDIAPDLNPHTIVRLAGGGRCRIEERRVVEKRVISFFRRLRIEPGSKRDYDAFAAMHYRAADELGFVDKVFVLREGPGGDPLGIVVYAHGPLELALRNEATNGWFSRNPSRVNQHLRILRRLVIHPDVRGCGLGHHLVRNTMPLLGTRYVECLAAMGEFNPVFEKAGMRRVGQYGVERRRQDALDALRAMDVDPHGPDFATHVARRRRVRAVVAKVVYDWYASTTAGGECRVARQSPEFLAQTFRGLVGLRPVYYLWRREVPQRDTHNSGGEIGDSRCPPANGDEDRSRRVEAHAEKSNPFERTCETQERDMETNLPASFLRNPPGARRAARPRRGHAAEMKNGECRRSKTEPRP